MRPRSGASVCSRLRATDHREIDRRRKAGQGGLRLRRRIAGRHGFSGGPRRVMRPTSHEKECKQSQAKPEARELSDGRACLAAFPGGTIDAAPFRVVHHETTKECRFRLQQCQVDRGVIRFRTADDRCQMLREKDQDDAVQAPAHSPNLVDGLPPVGSRPRPFLQFLAGGLRCSAGVAEPRTRCGVRRRSAPPAGLLRSIACTVCVDDNGVILPGPW